MDFTFKDIVLIVSIVGGAVATFFTTKFGLKEYIRDRLEQSTKELHELKIDIEKLKAKDEMQQVVIEALKSQVLDNLPHLYRALNDTKNDNGKGNPQ